MTSYDDSVLKRFWSYVFKTEECWLWLGPRTRGYGALAVPLGSHGASRRSNHIAAHRFSFLLHVGPIPDGLFILHRCDVKTCVNPTHLWPGTHADNMRDMAAKGRSGPHQHPESLLRGENHWTHIHPERLPRGERHGSKTHPERLRRGDSHPSRLYPERVKRGECQWYAKFTEAQIREIRQRYAAAQGRRGIRTELAREYGVQRGTIWFIVTRKTWAHVLD